MYSNKDLHWLWYDTQWIFKIIKEKLNHEIVCVGSCKYSQFFAPVIEWPPPPPSKFTTICWVSFRSWVVCVRSRIASRFSISCDCSLPLEETAKPSQARMPSSHEWWTSLLPAFPHLLNQAPPGAQQLYFPLFLRGAHFSHAGRTFLVVIPAFNSMNCNVGFHQPCSNITVLATNPFANDVLCCELTRTGFQALDPRVLHVGAATTSTVPKPQASRSTAAESAWFCEYPTLGTYGIDCRRC